MSHNDDVEMEDDKLETDAIKEPFQSISGIGINNETVSLEDMPAEKLEETERADEMINEERYTENKMDYEEKIEQVGRRSDDLIETLVGQNDDAERETVDVEKVDEIGGTSTGLIGTLVGENDSTEKVRYDNAERATDSAEKLDEIGGTSTDLIGTLVEEKDLMEKVRYDNTERETVSGEKVDKIGGTSTDLIRTLVEEKDLMEKVQYDNTERETVSGEKVDKIGGTSTDLIRTLVEEKDSMEKVQYDNAESETISGEKVDEIGRASTDLIGTLVEEKDSTEKVRSDNAESEMVSGEKVDEIGGTSTDLIRTLVEEKDSMEKVRYDNAERETVGGEKIGVGVMRNDLIGDLVGQNNLMEKVQFDNAERGMVDGEKIDEMGGVSTDLIGTLVGENDLMEEVQCDNVERETVDGEKIEEVGVTSEDVIQMSVGDDRKTTVDGEDKVHATVKDSEIGDAETSIEIDGEKVDPLIAEDGIPSGVLKPEVEVMTEAKANAGDACEGEQIIQLSDGIGDICTDVKCENSDDKSIVAEGTEMSEPTIVDEDISVGILKSPELDEDVSCPDNDEAGAEGEHPAVENKMETEAGTELELATDNVPDLQLDDGEAETELENQVVVDKGLDEAVKMETDETRSDLDEPGAKMDDTHDEEEKGTQDAETETETDVTESGQASATKRKRGKLSKNPSSSKPTVKSSSRKSIVEDVCFICLNGGDLFVCDRRGCPKAYHPSCVNRDEAFFRAKGRWNCGWHMCSSCEKTAGYFCYTCTFSLCKSCIKDAVILCVRRNKGFCETCMRTLTLVENIEQGNNEAQSQVNFDDKSSWEYLFRDYYTELKSKLSLSYEEIATAKSPYKGSVTSPGPRKRESSAAHVDTDDGGSGSDDFSGKLQMNKPKRRKLKKQSKSITKNNVATKENATSSAKSDWASKELLEFVSHMKDGDTSTRSQFDVQELLLSYIKSNKLRDPRRKSQIICDARLQNLFGKPRVGHFEMLKLLELHFLTTDEYIDDGHGSVVDTENNQLDIDDSGETKGRKRKARRKSDIKQSNLDDYAAIDMHNISLIYLRRKLMEDLLEDDDESFCEKSVGTFVRLRIPGSNQKQDLYRLVPVVGTSRAPEPYKVGKKTTDIMVEILNLDKTEIIPIDSISNQEYTEEECKRLRQSIKCGLLSRLTVGEILDKAMEIQVARVNDWLESETLRLSHLRDRASDLGHRKELRECVEKLQLLKTHEERRRRLEEIPKVHVDPKMDPSYESDENDGENEDSRRDAFMRSKGFNRRGRGPISPRNDISQKESWNSSTRVQNQNREFGSNLPSMNFSPGSTHVEEIANNNSLNLGDQITNESSNLDKLNSANNSDPIVRTARTVLRTESFSPVALQSPVKSGVAETVVKINESEKVWHYRDPSGKEQGPFSIVQLRKWNNSGYFPNGLKIWKSNDKETNSILLADALAGKFPKEFPSDDNIFSGTPLHRARTHTDVSPIAGKLYAEKWVSNEIANLPSPTPTQSNLGGNSVLPSPTVVLPSPASILNHVVQSSIPFSPTPNTQQVTVVGPTDPVHHQSIVTAEEHSVQMHGQAISSQTIQTETQGWSDGAMAGQPQGYSLGTPIPNVTSGTFSSPSTVAFPQPEPWKLTQGGQVTAHTPTMSNASWGMKPHDINTSPGLRAANPNAGWGQVHGNPNPGWGQAPGQAPNPVSTNAGWAAPGGPAGGNMNPPWGSAPVWGPTQAHGQAWVPPGGNPVAPAPVHGPISGNSWGPPNGGSRVAPPVQGHAQSQSNPGQAWGPPPGNQGSWIGEQNHNGGQFPNQMGGRVRDSGFGVSRPWNRGGGRPGGNFNRRDRVCPFNSNGQCRKGAFCDYLHV